MKKQIFLGLFMLGLAISGNGQNVVSNANLTSGGSLAGSGGTSSTYYGRESGKVATGISNTFIGHRTGTVVTGGTYNTFVGSNSGSSVIGAKANTFIGADTGPACTTGEFNTFLGQGSGLVLTTGQNNTFLGYGSGQNNKIGSNNLFVGYLAGTNVLPAMAVNNQNNTFIGTRAGYNNTGSNGVCIGYNAGAGNATDFRLYISNSADTTPLIWGDFNNDNLVFNGKVGITEESFANQANLFPTMAGGVDVSAYQLFVKGGILTEAVRVVIKSPANWADYVFEEGYNLAPLEEVECFIEENGHLPNVPSAEQLYSDGMELADMARIQQEKIEELTLYIIELDKQLTREHDINETQDAELSELKAQIKLLMQSQNKQ